MYFFCFVFIPRGKRGMLNYYVCNPKQYKIWLSYYLSLYLLLKEKKKKC